MDIPLICSVIRGRKRVRPRLHGEAQLTDEQAKAIREAIAEGKKVKITIVD